MVLCLAPKGILQFSSRLPSGGLGGVVSEVSGNFGFSRRRDATNTFIQDTTHGVTGGVMPDGAGIPRCDGYRRRHRHREIGSERFGSAGRIDKAVPAKCSIDAEKSVSRELLWDSEREGSVSRVSLISTGVFTSATARRDSALVYPDGCRLAVPRLLPLQLGGALLPGFIAVAGFGTVRTPSIQSLRQWSPTANWSLWLPGSLDLVDVDCWACARPGRDRCSGRWEATMGG